MSSITNLASLAESLYKSNYAQFFRSLAEVEQQYLIPNPLLAPHARYYVREMRVKAYSQLLESYSSLTLERMCRSFDVSEAFIDQDFTLAAESGANPTPTVPPTDPPAGPATPPGAGNGALPATGLGPETVIWGAIGAGVLVLGAGLFAFSRRRTNRGTGESERE